MAQQIRTAELREHLGLGVVLVREVTLEEFFSALAQAASDSSVQPGKGTSTQTTPVLVQVPDTLLGKQFLDALAYLSRATGEL